MNFQSFVSKIFQKFNFSHLNTVPNSKEIGCILNSNKQTKKNLEHTSITISFKSNCLYNALFSYLFQM